MVDYIKIPKYPVVWPPVALLQLYEGGWIPGITREIKGACPVSLEYGWWKRPRNESHYSGNGVNWLDFVAAHEFTDQEIAQGCGPSDDLTLRNITHAIWDQSVAEIRYTSL